MLIDVLKFKNKELNLGHFFKFTVNQKGTSFSFWHKLTISSPMKYCIFFGSERHKRSLGWSWYICFFNWKIPVGKKPVQSQQNNIGTTLLWRLPPYFLSFNILLSFSTLPSQPFLALFFLLWTKAFLVFLYLGHTMFGSNCQPRSTFPLTFH